MNPTPIDSSSTTLQAKLPHLKLIDDGKGYKVLYKDRAFIIGKVLFWIIDELKKEEHFSSIVQKLHQKESYGLEKEKLQNLLEEKIVQFNEQLEDTSTKRRSNYILLRTKIADDRLVGLLAQPLSILFKRSIFIPALVLIVVAQLFYIYFGPESSELLTVKNLTTSNFLFAYLLATVVLLFHELGHAAAAKGFGVDPQEIGFGFYLIFPVFYADVTAVWQLDKYERIIVNIGGVYFQALINVFIIFFLCFFSEYSLSLKIIALFLYKINIAVILYSLMPFFRNDGYWIYSDLFELPNLNQRAYAYPKNLFKSFQKSYRENGQLKWNSTADKVDWPLMIYSLTNYVVITFFFYFFLQVIGTTAGEVLLAFNSSEPIDDKLQLALKVGFLIFSIGLMLYNYLEPITNWLKRQKNVQSTNLQTTNKIQRL